MKPFYLYILRCADGSYYVGQTDDLEQRIANHHAGTYGGYTSLRRPLQLVYSAEFATRYEAVSRERQLKGWSRAKKEALIRADWERIYQLARCRSAPSTPPSMCGLRQAQAERIESPVHPEHVEG